MRVDNAPFRCILRRSSLQRQLIIGCLVLLSLSLLLACLLFLVIFKDYNRARMSYENLHLYQQVLSAANAISAERGPTNTMLGGNFPETSEAMARLSSYRWNTDAQIAKVSALTGTNRYLGAEIVLEANSNLEQARQMVDGELTKPFNQRTLLSLQGAIQGMFNAVDAIRPLINTAALHSLEGEGDMADEALIGQKLFEIRDYAGRLGSILTPYIATRQPISPEDHEKLQKIRGRILQLWELTRPYLIRYAELNVKIKDVEKIFFISGMDLVNLLESEGESGSFSYSTRTMTEAIVPTFAPLEVVRTSYLELMADRSKEKFDAAFFWLVLTAMVIALVIVIDVVLMVWAHRKIFKPLLVAKSDIVALSEERRLDLLPRAINAGSEIDEVFKSLAVLQVRLSERQELTAKLKSHAFTDGLTGLLNRRAFDQIGMAEAAYDYLPVTVALILIDIDHFKLVNDKYGHAVGDFVLRAVARILTSLIRAGDMAARYGGEEFAIILSTCSVEQARLIAEKLRATISGSPVSVAPGEDLNVTASFGISLGARGGEEWRSTFSKADKALYQAKKDGRNCVRQCVD